MAKRTNTNTDTDQVDQVDQVPAEAPVDPEPVAETPVAAIDSESNVPVEGAVYRAREAFTAQIGAQLCTFAAGVELDPLAGVMLAASGAPVDVIAG